MMSQATIEGLRVVNHNLRAGLIRLQAGRDRSVAIAPTEFADLLAELLRVSDGLRSLAEAAALDAEIAQEVSEYRSNLSQLEKALPSAQARLLVEKARLENAKAHMARAAAWAQAQAKTL